jgi:hypothetical protein
MVLLLTQNTVQETLSMKFSQNFTYAARPSSYLFRTAECTAFLAGP